MNFPVSSSNFLINYLLFNIQSFLNHTKAERRVECTSTSPSPSLRSHHLMANLVLSLPPPLSGLFWSKVQSYHFIRFHCVFLKDKDSLEVRLHKVHPSDNNKTLNSESNGNDLHCQKTICFLWLMRLRNHSLKSCRLYRLFLLFLRFWDILELASLRRASTIQSSQKWSQYA